MKSIMNLKTTSMTIAITLMAATCANAASTNKIFLSNTLIFLFLGLCAAVVAIQLIPSIIMLYGMLKAALEHRKENAHATSKSR
jgi:hypothetical protein